MAMRRPPRPQPLAVSTAINTTSNPFASVLNENDPASEKRITVEDIIDDVVVSDDDDDSYTESRGGRQKPPRPSMAATARMTALTASAKRRRRRSSARFLQLGGSSRRLSSRRGSMGGGDNDDDDTNNEASNTQSEGNLSELYQKAIRMNAENKINAVNSWNLRLIENIDMFLEGDDESDEEMQTPSNAANSTDAVVPMSTNNKRVNFTKASCTLDASVKIYSYRVDDVHLTSYKVLANLNRTDTQKPNKNNNADFPEDNGDDAGPPEKRSSNKSSGSTLETHLANINLNKLDSAFDIDPLFHKMSKTFDEGGAKGLLLANLGVGEHGCNIVFDSSHDDDHEVESVTADNDKPPRLAEGMMDVTSLTLKLESLLQEQDAETIHSMPLVPQLSALRAEHEVLEAGGFVENGAAALAATVGPKTPGRRRYHANAEEEREADYSIHKEAMERSRLSAGQNLSMRLLNSPDNEQKDHDEDDFVDFGGGYDDGDDDDNGFDTFIAAAGSRYSEISFTSGGANDAAAVTTSKPDFTTTTNLIDAIASGETVLSGNDYEYFNQEAVGGSNLWAGAAHWKRAAVNSKKDAAQSKKNLTKKTPKKSTKKKECALVSLTVAPDLSHLFAAKTGTKRKSSTQLSKAMITKHTNQENLLPEDSGFQVEQLTKLFLRPNAVLKKAVAAENGEGSSDSFVGGKTVGFQLPDWDDDSYGGGGDNDGAGFDFGGEDHDEDDDEFLVQELDGVRKVEKVRVGYAAVAKKVDVKRLKRDLWAELESKFASRPRDDDDANPDENKEEETEDTERVVSFQDAFHELEQQQSQMDATLPFYFICILHLANEKGLRLESCGLDDFTIHHDDDNNMASQLF